MTKITSVGPASYNPFTKMIEASKERQRKIRKQLILPFSLGLTFILATFILPHLAVSGLVPLFVPWIPLVFCIPFTIWVLILVSKDERESRLQKEYRSQL